MLITQAEDGTYLVGGQHLADDGVVTAANGHRDRLTLGATGWSADFATNPFAVNLGRLGGTRTLELREDGKYWLGNTEVKSGATVTNDDGNEYTLTLDSAAGMWTAIFQAGTVTIALASSGESVTLTRCADGTYGRDRESLSTGTVVFSSNDVGYRLELTAEGWTARICCVADVPPCADGPGTGSGGNTGTGTGGTTTTRSDNLETDQSLPASNDPTLRTKDGYPDPDEGTTLVIAAQA